jgi:hypothetical protein
MVSSFQVFQLHLSECLSFLLFVLHIHSLSSLVLPQVQSLSQSELST